VNYQDYFFTYRREEESIRSVMGKPEVRRPTGRLRRKRKDNIKMNLRNIGWGCTDWIHLAQHRD
jgi:hypothetical protein